ncbi:hypothetical protein [Williamsia sp.]|uniref:hypothetical protein n=1 Tax=Williamsia sp. TaxID=1872085 RepID=UPI002F928ABD
MAGNPDNAILFSEADVYILRRNKLGAGQTVADFMPESSTDPFSEEWDLVGLLNGDDGFGEEREWDETDHSAWGYGVIKVGSRNFAMTRSFTALEPENDTNSYLYSPGDTSTHVRVAQPAEEYIAFETRGDDGKTRRLVTTRPARITAPSKTQNEADLASLEFSARIFPNSNKELFLKQNADTDGVAADTDEINRYRIRLTGGPTGGTFSLAYAFDGDTDTVAGVPVAGTPSAVETLLESLDTVGADNVEVSGVPGNWIAEFDLDTPGVLTSPAAALTGGTTPAVVVEAA